MALFTSLHRYLGQPPGPITSEMLDAAVADRLPETDDLDWKSKLYAGKELVKSDFPKDVAAMANRGGGTLVFGITEHEKCATGREDVGPLGEQYERALRSAATSAISPPIIGLEILSVGETGNYALVVAVPATTDAPHLVHKDQFYGAPIRNNAQTDWMREPQIEAMYRARLEQRRHAMDTLDNLYSEAVTNWTSAHKQAWMVAVAHPRLPATNPTRPTRDEARAVFESAMKLALVYVGRGAIHPFDNVDTMNPRPGLRRWFAVNTRTEEKHQWRAAWVAIHHDGSVTVTAAVGGHRASQNENNLPNEVTADAIQAVIADFMALVRAGGERFGASEYEVRVGIEQCEGPGEHGLKIVTVDNQGFFYDDTSLTLTRYAPVVSTVDAAASADDFYCQVRDLALDCVNQGGITGVRQINPPACGEAGLTRP